MTAPERGKTGDHGQDGLQGERGRTGPRGPAYSSWLTRNVVKGYLILLILNVVAYIVMAVGFDRVIDRVNRVASIDCQAGNERSDLQHEDFLENIRQTETLDLGRLFGIDEEQVKEFRRLSRESAERRIARLPYVDCLTGEKVSPPPR